MEGGKVQPKKIGMSLKNGENAKVLVEEFAQVRDLNQQQ